MSKVTELSEICVGIWSLTSALLTLGGLQHGYFCLLQFKSSETQIVKWGGMEHDVAYDNLSQKAQREPLKRV